MLTTNFYLAYLPIAMLADLNTIHEFASQIEETFPSFVYDVEFDPIDGYLLTGIKQLLYLQYQQKSHPYFHLPP